MKIKIFAILLIITLFSCTKELIPDAIKIEVEAFMQKKDYSVFEHEKLIRIDWNNDTIVSAVGIIYPFALVWERNGKEYPFKHRAIVKADTLADILAFSYLSDTWVSIIPIPYDVRKEAWWVELAEVVDVDSLKYERRELEQIDSSQNTWRVLFIGNVRLVSPLGVISTDTLYWNPKKNEMKARYCEIRYQVDTSNYLLSGFGLTSNADFSEWVIEHAVGQQWIDDVNED
jgi:hypothetical protein